MKSPRPTLQGPLYTSLDQRAKLIEMVEALFDCKVTEDRLGYEVPDVITVDSGKQRHSYHWLELLTRVVTPKVTTLLGDAHWVSMESFNNPYAEKPASIVYRVFKTLPLDKLLEQPKVKEVEEQPKLAAYVS